jgi:hypothetical protein
VPSLPDPIEAEPAGCSAVDTVEVAPTLQLILGSFGPANGIEVILGNNPGTDAQGPTVNGVKIDCGAVVWGQDTGIDSFDFSGATLDTAGLVSARTGNDSVDTAAVYAFARPVDYDGGGGSDTVTINLSAGELGALEDAALTAVIDYVDNPVGKVLNNAGDSLGIGLTARNFEAAFLNDASLQTASGRRATIRSGASAASKATAWCSKPTTPAS